MSDLPRHLRQPLPAGNITLMFTDIQDSSALWERMGDAFRPTLTRHDELVRQITAAWDGYEVKSQGDSFMVAFARATDAVQCAVELQQAFAHEEWPPKVGELLVRIGLHTGEPFLGYDSEGRPDYFGPVVNRAARIADAGHGGQTLVSLATREVVQGALTTDIELAELGRRRLRGLGQAETVFEVRHPSLPQRQFPPLRTMDVVRTNLPAQLTSFIGRERELTELRELLDKPGARLLTLTGVGGCGKTRLALQVGGPLLDEYEHGVWLVELAALSDPALVLHTAASTLGMKEEPGRELGDALSDYLRPKSLLLVLDNCEHVLDACAHLADKLLRGCPGLRVLATSREALGIAGEMAYRVPSLALPDSDRLWPVEDPNQYDAITLFADRAATALPGFAVSTDNAATAARICQRLDGIPFALELAAARLRTMPLEELADRLDNRFTLLTGGSRAALPRQQTLRATMDWSYQLLSEAERALLSRLSVFAGGWTLEAAEAVCSGDGIDHVEVLDLLARLWDKSMVVVGTSEQERRYSFLLTVRQLAAERLLESGEVETLRDRHLRFFVDLAERLHPAVWEELAPSSAERLTAEHDNLRTALNWAYECSPEMGLRIAVALDAFWYFANHDSEARDWFGKLLPRTAGAPSALRAQALVAAGGAAIRQYSHPHFNREQVVGLLREGLVLARQAGDMQSAAMALQRLGHVASIVGDDEGAAGPLRESLASFQAAGDKRHACAVLGALAEAATRQADHEEAERLLEEALALAPYINDIDATGTVLRGAGYTAYARGDHARALPFLEESLASLRQTGLRQGIAWSLVALGDVSLALRDTGRAALLFEECLALSAEAGNRQQIGRCLHGFAKVALAAGQPERCARLLGAAEALLESTDLPGPCCAASRCPLPVCRPLRPGRRALRGRLGRRTSVEVGGGHCVCARRGVRGTEFRDSPRG